MDLYQDFSESYQNEIFHGQNTEALMLSSLYSLKKPLSWFGKGRNAQRLLSFASVTS